MIASSSAWSKINMLSVDDFALGRLSSAKTRLLEAIEERYGSAP